jgi:hypothetical protein
MDNRRLAQKIYEAAESMDNDYDAIEAIQKVLDDNSFEIPVIESGEEQDVWVFSKASAMSMDVRGVYESKEMLLQELKRWFGDDLTMEEMLDYEFQREMEIDIEGTILYKQKQS